LADSPQGLVGRFEYNTDLFDVATIGSLSTRWIALLDTLVSNPAARLGDLPLVTADEQRALAEGAAVIRRPLAVRTIHERFEAQVDRAANACVADETNAIGYQELNARANQWARYLKRRGLRADTRAALCITRSIDMVVGALAILKAGGAYVPLDPSHPTGRLAGVLADCDTRILVADRSALARLPPFTGRIVCLDDDETDIREEETSNLHEAVQPEQAAYVLYTSGSTGSPNGVVVAHESVCNLLESMQRTPGLRPHDRLLSVTTLAFDIAGLELFLPLITGASLMIAGEETVRDGQRLMDRLMGFDATVMQATPSTWRMLLDAGWPGKADLAVLCGGEALTRDLAAQLLPRCGALWNMYGPTETTIWSTTTRISGVDDRRISLGFPIDNTEVYVLDGRLQPTPPGVPGEIFIGGIGLARGYLGRPDLTAARFVPHPFSQLPGARLYRTGDRGRQRSDGSLEFLGRLDDQVKVRGFRVELRELERALAEHPAVRHAVAALGQDPRGESALVAYVVLDRTGSGPAAGMERELREHLAAMLPVYMVPAAVVLLHELPLTPNGKVDRRRLPPVVWGSAAALASQPGSAREQIIRDIWRDVLKIDRVGMTDNFFDLGGHSLLLNDVRTRIVSAFARDVPTIEFFQRPTIRALARYLDDHGLAPDFAEAHALHAADRRRAAGSRQRELKRRRMHGATLRDE
jgi:amino acid adenylation domain-containing protein